MKNTTQSKVNAYIARAQAMGSTATTLKGAGRFVLANTSSPLGKQDARLGVLADTSWRSTRNPYTNCTPRLDRDGVRTARLIARYAGLKKFPSYLSEADRKIVTESREHQNIMHVRTLPDYAREFFIADCTRKLPRLAKEIRSFTGLGELVNSWIVGNDACNTRWAGAHDGRMSRTRGNSVLPNPVGGYIRETGSNSNWNKRSTFERHINYTLIKPKRHGNTWTMYYIAPNQTAHKVYRTANFVLIDDRNPVKIDRKSEDAKPLPIHIQRRMLALYTPAALKLDYDREAKKLMLVDALGEKYHLCVIHTLASARAQIRAAISAFRTRRAEKVKELNGNATRVFVALEDSYEAGNCKSMSDEFARKMWGQIGAEGPCAVRADVILAARNDSYTKRACAYAATR